MRSLRLLVVSSYLALVKAASPIRRQQIVQEFNVRRNASSSTTPLQVGNGNFAFGVDVTGLQTFKPFATMSTWGWHNFSLPTTPNQTSIDGEKSPSSPLTWVLWANAYKITLGWTGGLHRLTFLMTDSSSTTHSQILLRTTYRLG